MSLWGVTGVSGVAPFLVAALLGGGHATVAGHGIYRDAGPAPLIRSSARLAASELRLDSAATPPLSVPGSAPAAVLRQTGSGQWQTTVLLNDIAPGCGDASKADYLLATTSPDGLTPEVKSPKPHITTGPGGGTLTGSWCEVQVAFTGSSQAPQTAALVIDQPGASSTIILTVSRNVTLISYLVIPLAVGLVIAALYFILAFFITIYDDAGRKRRHDRDWWEHPILGSGAWTINDSWATNISTGLVAVSAVLTTTAAASSLFPGIALDRFTLVNIAAGAIVAAAPVIFGILYAGFTARNPGLTPDAILRLPLHHTVTIKLPSGASITMSADTTVHDSSGNAFMVRTGSAYQIPAGSEIVVSVGDQAVVRGVALAAAPLIDRVLEEAVEQAIEDAATRLMRQALLRSKIQDAVMAGAPVEVHIIDRMVAAAGIQSARKSVAQAVIGAIERAAEHTHTFEAVTFPGTSDVGVLPGSILLINALSGTWTIQKTDMVKSAPWDESRDVAVTYPVRVDADGGAKITVTGAADMSFPEGAVISAPWRKDYKLPRERKLLAPLGSELIVANMKIMLIANCVTMLGIGAELGLGGVLAYFSEASLTWRIIIMCAVALVGGLVLAYARSATRAMADPQPGSSLSALAGTSFTL